MTDTWSWSDIGKPNAITDRDHAHTVRHDYGRGYAATRPGSTKMQKSFTVYHNAMTNAQRLKLIEFFRSQLGAANAFYWEYPVALYGGGGYGGYAGLEPADGFDQEYDTGFGGGPAFLVRMEKDSLEMEARGHRPGYWRVSYTLREVA